MPFSMAGYGIADDLNLVMKKTFLAALTLVLAFRTVVNGQTDVLMQHNDQNGTGWNPNETTLNTTNVKNGNFGKIATHSVDGAIFSQPLVVSGITIAGTSHNLLVLTTGNNSIYVYDADNTILGAPPLWTVNYTNSTKLPTTTATYRPPAPGDMFPDLCSGQYNDFKNSFGIVGTPFIDKANKIIYFVSRSVNPTLADDHAYVPNSSVSYKSGGFYQLLHAVDLTNGSELLGGPKLITASAAGDGDSSLGGTIHFDPRRNNQRPGLTLSNGILYIAYSSHCDMDPYHGWVLGYDVTNLNKTTDAPIAYITTPHDGRGGIWMSGGAPTVDPSGNLYVTSGNADEANIGGVPTSADASILENRGESAIKLTPNTLDHTASKLNISSYFTSQAYVFFNSADLDMPIQTMLIPNTNLLITGIKDGNLYVMDRRSLGGYTKNGPDNVLQIVPVGSNANMHSSLAYFNAGGGNQYLYQMSENTALKAFPISGTFLGTPVVSTVNNAVGGTGGFLSVSSNGSAAGSGILWVWQPIPSCTSAGQGSCPGLLRAVSATDVTKELWNSSYEGDDPGTFTKMAPPTIANGKVYLPTQSQQVVVYGVQTNTCGTTNLALSKPATASTTDGNPPLVAGNAFDGDFTTRWLSQNEAQGLSNAQANDQYVYVDLGVATNVCQVFITWEGGGFAASFQIELSTDASTWTVAGSPVTMNTSLVSQVSFAPTMARYVKMHGTLRGMNNPGFGFSIFEMEVYGTVPPNSCLPPLNPTISNITQNSATVSWTANGSPVNYNILYKSASTTNWTTVSNISGTSFNLTGLANENDYLVQIQANCSGGGESVFASTAFSTLPGSGSCHLQTRYFKTDVGSTGMAGNSCWTGDNGGTWTVSGGGNSTNGLVASATSDAFQYAYTGLAVDETVTAQVASQDPQNAVGIMSRDNLNPNAKFAYIAKTGAGQIIFAYRTATGGPSVITTVTAAGPYLKLVKIGSTYAGFYSADGINWTQVGSTIDATFGATGTFDSGLATTSTVSGVLTNAVVFNFNDGSGSSPLPVTLVNFTATNINNDYVELKWATEQEVNNDYFEVQRSTDASQFTDVTSVKGVGNSSTTQYYSSNDDRPNQGVNFYRLKQVDLDGKFAYSPIVSVHFGKGYSPLVFPNPATSYFNVVPGEDPVKEITVYSVLGTRVYQLEISNASNMFTIPTNTFAAGVYIVKIKTANQIYQQKLIKQ
jgi:hypothetical protein